MKYLLALILALPAFGAPLHSNPMAPNAIWLDPSGGWTATADQMYQTWLRVGGYFHQWNVDVIANDNPGVRSDVVWIIIGGQSPGGNIVGQAATGTWQYGTAGPFGPATGAYVYSDALGNDPDYVAYVIAHETGHNLGEGHEDDGIMLPVVDLSRNYWTPKDVADFDGWLGIAPVPEPSLLWVGLVGLAMRRRH